MFERDDDSLSPLSIYSAAVILHAVIFAVGASLIKSQGSAGLANGASSAVGASVEVALVAGLSSSPPVEPVEGPIPQEQPREFEPLPVRSEMSKPAPEKKSTVLPSPSKRVPDRQQVVSKAPPKTQPIPPNISEGSASAASPNESPSAATGVDGARGSAGAASHRGTPDYLSNPAPIYPPVSRRLREEGVVLLRVAITAGGAVESVALAKSSGFERLDNAALSAVRGWRFKPSTVGGIAISDTVEVPIRFALR